jgi:hypothetical protein
VDGSAGPGTDTRDPPAGLDLDALGGKGFGHHLGGFGLLLEKQAGEGLHQGHGHAEPGEGLGQLASDGAAANHGQGDRALGEIEDGLVGEIGGGGQAGYGRHRRLRPGGQHHPIGRHLAPVHVEELAG